MREEALIKGMMGKGAALVGLFVIGASFFNRLDVFVGAAVGSLMAYGDFLLMCYLSEEVLKLNSRSVFWGVQAFKYLIMAVVLGVLFFYKVANPVATVAGLSLLVLIPFTEIGNLKNI